MNKTRDNFDSEILRLQALQSAAPAACDPLHSCKSRAPRNVPLHRMLTVLLPKAINPGSMLAGRQVLRTGDSCSKSPQVT